MNRFTITNMMLTFKSIHIHDNYICYIKIVHCVRARRYLVIRLYQHINRESGEKPTEGSPVLNCNQFSTGNRSDQYGGWKRTHCHALMSITTDSDNSLFS